MKLALKVFLALFIALVLGVGSAFYVLSSPGTAKFGSISNGPWTTSLTLGSRSQGMYEKAVVAKMGLFALNKEETIYYTAFSDSSGEGLRTGSRYRIDGEELDTRWWSLTVYGSDNFLIPNPHKRYAYAMNNVAREDGGRYTILLSKSQQEGNWLPLGEKDQPFSLTLRLYNPSQKVYENLDTIKLPRIIKEVK